MLLNALKQFKCAATYGAKTFFVLFFNEKVKQISSL